MSGSLACIWATSSISANVGQSVRLSRITGAAGQLAPVWVEAGRPAARHAEDRARLTRWNGPRALLFLTAATLPMLGYKCSGMPALTALVWFGIVFGAWLYRDKN